MPLCCGHCGHWGHCGHQPRSGIWREKPHIPLIEIRQRLERRKWVELAAIYGSGRSEGALQVDPSILKDRVDVEVVRNPTPRAAWARTSLHLK